MNKVTLRDYQQSGIDQVSEAIRQGFKKILIIAPTGAGKGVVISYLLTKTVNSGRGYTAALIAHRVELLRDTAQRCLEMYGTRSTIKAPKHAATNYPIKLWSVQTLARREYTDKPYLLIVDEAHRIAANSYQGAVKAQHDNGGILIGLTATPERADGSSMAEHFDKIIVLASTQKLIKDKILVPERIKAPDIDIDFSKISFKKTSEGVDYNMDQMSEAYDKINIYQQVVESYNTHTPDKLALCFHVSVANGLKQVDFFRGAGIRSAMISANTSDVDRRLIKKEFEQGRLKVIVNVGLYVEGIDMPACEVVIMCFKTKSASKYIQSAGRGARPIWGEDGAWAKNQDGSIKKPFFWLLDFGGNVWEHGRWSDYDLGGFHLDRVKKDKPKKNLMPCINCGEPIRVPTTEDIECPACGQIHMAEDFLVEKEETKDKSKAPKKVELLDVQDADAFRAKIANMKSIKRCPNALLRSYALVHRISDNALRNIINERNVTLVQVMAEEAKHGVAAYYNKILSSKPQKPLWK